MSPVEDDRPTAVQVDAEEVEAGEDSLPDWRQFAKLAKASSDEPKAIPFIPKRGEKDFEPIPPSDIPLTGNEALLSQHQLNTLNESRTALFAALASGSRQHSSKNYNSFTWRPEVDGGRATCDAGQATYGIHFLTVGRYDVDRKRIELMPEEALYLAERGALELWSEKVDEEGKLSRVPMSVQQAWSEIMGHDELTLERFQVYSHLKRLGYVVVRARVPPPPAPKTKAVVKPSFDVLRLFRLPFSTLSGILLGMGGALANLRNLLLPPKARLGLTRIVDKGEGVVSALVAGRRWSTYDKIFGHFQIIPSGYDKLLPRGPEPHASSVLEPLIPTTAPSIEGLPDLEQHPYQTFFHVYKPVTKYRKTAPPPPDFRLVVINAATTPLPDLFEFVSMFDSTPFPEEDTLLPPPRPAPLAPPPNSAATPARPPRKPRAPPPKPSTLNWVLSHLPYGPKLIKETKPSPYPRLKSGRRSILVAVVDNGTSSFLMFSEAEFAKLPWKGQGRKLRPSNNASGGGGLGDFKKLPDPVDSLRDMDFHDGQQTAPANFAVPLTPPPNVLNALANAPRQNAAEQNRLQGLMVGGVGGGKEDVNTTRWTRLRAWMVNEGSRKIFVGGWILVQLMLYTFGFLNYQLKVARSAALVLNFDVAFILLPVCRNFISILRRGPLNSIIPFEKNITFHKAVAWSIVFFTIVHILAHIVNVIELAVLSSPDPLIRLKTFALTNVIVGPGYTGWLMTAILGIMVWFAMEKRRRANFEKFWYTHHLCEMAHWASLRERVMREVRSRHRTYISKVVHHPNNVVEIQIKKEKTTTRAGQYIFLNVPEISYFQWHPFTLTSAPEEDYISVHIREFPVFSRHRLDHSLMLTTLPAGIVGDFTRALALALGCNLDKKGEKEGDRGAEVVNPPVNKVLPRVMVDGPFGSASEDVFKFEVSVLVGAGIGVTPFASILKSIWYRLNFPSEKKTRLRKVYFIWICRDFNQLEWFQSLLLAIEEQDLSNFIEIHTYVTTKVKEDDINNIIVQDVGGERDTISHLRSPTHYGRPNWDRIFQSIAEKHPSTEAGVFFCGPKVLGSTLHKQCNKWTNGSDEGVKFVWGKENF
ncbi:hypothetical protein MNV49_000812 [Pseudohyphozyma bogoriensis]|nr:hypothetical protein MNV49_000812 [Pseudohyphozyma bogoriensis]